MVVPLLHQWLLSRTFSCVRLKQLLVLEKFPQYTKLYTVVQVCHSLAYLSIVGLLERVTVTMTEDMLRHAVGTPTRRHR